MTDRQILNIYSKLRDTGASDQQVVAVLKSKGIDIEALRANKQLMSPPEMQRHHRWEMAQDYKENPEQYEPPQNEFSQLVRGTSLDSPLRKPQPDDKDVREKAQERFGEYLVNIFREFGQGATFGSADELEGWLRSMTGGGTTDEEIDKVRAEIQQFRDSPQNKQGEVLGMKPSTAGEVAGALTFPFFLTAKLATMLPVLGSIKAGQWVRNLLKRSVLGGLGGGIDMYLYGVGTDEGNIHDRATGEQAKEYAKLGVGLGVPLGVGGYALEKGVGVVGDKLVKGNRKSMQSIISANKMDNMEIQDLSDFLDEVIKRGDTEIAEKMVLGDLGKTGGMLQRTTEASSLASPSIMGEATETFTERAAKFPEFARDQVKKFVGRRVHDADQFKNRIFRFAKNIAQPHYNLADPVVVDLPKVASEINRLMGQKDNVGKMVRKAWAKTRIKLPQLIKKKMERGVDMSAEGFGPWGTEKVPPIPGEKAGGPVPILYYDTFKQYLDQELSTMAKSIKGDTLARLDEGELLGLRNLINTSLQDSSESYRKATGIWENAHKNTQAFKKGIDAHKNTSMSAKTVRTQMNSMSEAEKKAYRLGYGYGMYGKIQNANLAFANETKILRLFSEEEPEKLKSLFKSPEVALDFIKKIKTIGDMDYFGKQVLKGSPTFQRQQVEKLLQEEPSMMTKALDTVQMMRGAPRIAGSISDAMENTATKNRIAGMGPYLARPGIQNMKRTLKDLTEEERRWLNEKRGRAQATQVMPSLLSPSEEVRGMKFPSRALDYGYGLLF